MSDQGMFMPLGKALQDRIRQAIDSRVTHLQTNAWLTAYEEWSNNQLHYGWSVEPLTELPSSVRSFLQDAVQKQNVKAPPGAGDIDTANWDEIDGPDLHLSAEQQLLQSSGPGHLWSKADADSLYLFAPEAFLDCPYFVRFRGQKAVVTMLAMESEISKPRYTDSIERAIELKNRGEDPMKILPEIDQMSIAIRFRKESGYVPLNGKMLWTYLNLA